MYRTTKKLYCTYYFTESSSPLVISSPYRVRESINPSTRGHTPWPERPLWYLPSSFPGVSNVTSTWRYNLSPHAYIPITPTDIYVYENVYRNIIRLPTILQSRFTVCMNLRWKFTLCFLAPYRKTLSIVQQENIQ